jgi:hypothetical protein
MAGDSELRHVSTGNDGDGNLLICTSSQLVLVGVKGEARNGSPDRPEELKWWPDGGAIGERANLIGLASESGLSGAGSAGESSLVLFPSQRKKARPR